uniref:Uncharacterized protein n=1 Tax=Mola mola TaxID=94237 RepID=A0A3Q3XE76_MOLML
VRNKPGHEFCKSVLWSDEAEVEPSGNMDVAFKLGSRIPSVKHAGGSHVQVPGIMKSALNLRLGPRWVLQRGNDPRHTSKLVLERPAQISFVMRICVSTLGNHTILAQLEQQFATEEWAKIPQETCANIHKSKNHFKHY